LFLNIKVQMENTFIKVEYIKKLGFFDVADVHLQNLKKQK